MTTTSTTKKYSHSGHGKARQGKARQGKDADKAKVRNNRRELKGRRMRLRRVVLLA